MIKIKKENKLTDFIPMIIELKEKNEILKDKIREIQNTKELCKKCIYGKGFGLEEFENKCEFFTLCSFEATDILIEDLII